MYSQFGSSQQTVRMAKAYQAEQQRAAGEWRLAAQSRARRARGGGRLRRLLATLTPRARRPRPARPKMS